MTWVRLDDSFLDHPKFLELDATSLRVWLRALCYANRHGTDGVIADVIATRLGATARVRAQLFRAPHGYLHGLWERGDGFVRIHDYAQFQPDSRKRSELAEHRALAGRLGGVASGRARRSDRSVQDGARAEPEASLDGARAERVSDKHTESFNTDKRLASRASKHAAKPRPVPSRPVPDLPPGSPLVAPNASPAGEPDGHAEPTSSPTPRAVTNATDDGAFGLAIAAWADGVGRATGNRFVLPPRGGSELQKVIAAIAAHCPDPAGRVEWAREAGEAYGRAYRGDRPNAHDFLDWENGGRSSPRERSSPKVQPAPASGRLYAIGDDGKSGTGT